MQQRPPEPAGTAPPPELPPAEVAPLDASLAPVDRRRNLVRVPQLALGALRLVRQAAPRTLALSFSLQVAIAVLTGVQLLVIKELVTGLVDLAQAPGSPVGAVVPAFAALLGVTLANGLLAAALAEQQKLLTEIVGRHTMDLIIDVATTVELSDYEDPTFYDQLQRATTAGMVRPIAMVQSLMALVLAVLTSIGIVAALLALEPLLVPLVVLAGVPVLLATLRNSRQAYRFEYGMTTHGRERMHLMELMTARESAKELRVFDAAGFLRRRYDALSDERVRRLRGFLRQRMKVSMTGTVASAAGSAIALGSLIWLLATGRTDIATAATAAIAMQVLAGRLVQVTGSLGRLVESSLFLEDLHAFLALGERRRARPRPEAATSAGDFEELRVEGLSFAYPGTDRRVLDDVSLELRRGEIVALVGENGSGKTTLVKLMCQLYRNDDGRILWNGTDVRDLDPAALRSTMTVLFQDFVQYHLTVAENIALGRSDVPVDDERIAAAARQAGADALTAQLPKGYDTRLGRQFAGGFELSGGQWQRLALARAFYRGGDVLVMDEPTAALDPRAEARLFEQMRELAQGKSVLLISHRFSSVRMADRIYVLDGGRVVEAGGHEELMRRDGLYAELFRLQASAYLDEVPGPAAAG